MGRLTSSPCLILTQGKKENQINDIIAMGNRTQKGRGIGSKRIWE